MANTMSTDCFRKKWMQIILKQFLTSLLLFLTSSITIIVDVRHGTWSRVHHGKHDIMAKCV